MSEPVLVAAIRTPVGRAPKGVLSTTRPDDLAATAITGALDRLPALDKSEIDDVILGCAQPEGEQGWNIARYAALRAGLPVEIPGATVNRLCASGLEAIAVADQRIRSGLAQVIVAGGAESMSLIPMGGNKPSPNPWLAENYPASLLTMGLTAERVARHYSVSRDDQDAFSLSSHQKALAAQAAGRFAEELVPVTVTTATPDSKNGKPHAQEKKFSADEGPRADTSATALAQLKPVFHAQGTVTAGNSSQTSDGAAAAILMDASRAQQLGIAPLARLVSYAVTGCLPEEMGIGPITAIPKALKLAGLTLNDIELIELNEAFAAQVLAIVRTLGLDPARVNINGGAIALGHPLGCTGAKLTATLLREMKARSARYGMVTMCVGGGMGAAGIFENLDGGAS
ncbi:3-ketoacyl-CoA thiolase (thiolase I) [Candidatus Sulfotelmatomonas gaucii]|uniref:acetyl-CoA C-acyltransferase n=1 Tax=Candidatus Sulfuritelmatomonas gaucii TaxID=2043161 RepID=A0A2N9L6Y4_9BACT|nr:3-ketoacyl-CoA thiolase (thiolase I) [Candidatus Sulfotelmatomonas gaucii]